MLSKYSFWIDKTQRDALRFVCERDGIRESEQIRRAIKAWLLTKRIKPKVTKRPSSRKRA